MPGSAVSWALVAELRSSSEPFPVMAFSALAAAPAASALLWANPVRPANMTAASAAHNTKRERLAIGILLGARDSSPLSLPPQHNFPTRPNRGAVGLLFRACNRRAPGACILF